VLTAFLKRRVRADGRYLVACNVLMNVLRRSGLLVNAAYDAVPGFLL